MLSDKGDYKQITVKIKIIVEMQSVLMLLLTSWCLGDASSPFGDMLMAQGFRVQRFERSDYYIWWHLYVMKAICWCLRDAAQTFGSTALVYGGRKDTISWRVIRLLNIWIYVVRCLKEVANTFGDRSMFWSLSKILVIY